MDFFRIQDEYWMNITGQLTSPAIWTYADGGIEYLKEFSDCTQGSIPCYNCELFIPELKTILAYSHPVKNKSLQKKLIRQSLE